jgi:uncharacterized protein YqeY
MSLLDRIQKDMTEAMRARDEARLNAIRLIKTALKKHEVDSMKPLDENTELQVLNTLVKQRRDAKEEAELKLVESYMPASAGEQEIDAAIDSALNETGVTSSRQMGVVMKAVQARLAGRRVDGRALS